MAQHNELGKNGEIIAYRHVTQQLKMRLLERNWRYKQWEIDLIATDGEYIVIIEVKTRNMTTIVNAETAVDHKKKVHLCHAADQYVRSRGLSIPVRFDVVSVYYNPSDQTYEVQYFPNAFQAIPVWQQRNYKKYSYR